MSGQHHKIDDTAQRSPQRLASRAVETRGRKEWVGRASPFTPFAATPVPPMAASGGAGVNPTRQRLQPLLQGYARADLESIGDIAALLGFDHAGPGSELLGDRSHGLADRVCDPVFETRHFMPHARTARPASRATGSKPDVGLFAAATLRRTMQTKGGLQCPAH